MICGGVVRLSVRDVSQAVRFYVEVLGMKLVEHAEGSAMIDAGDGFRVELVHEPSAARGGAAVGLHAKMPLAESRAILENRGVVFDPGTTRFHDPDGNVLFLLPAR